MPTYEGSEHCGFTHSTHSYSSLVSSLLIVGLSLALYSWFFNSFRPAACAVHAAELCLALDFLHRVSE